MSPRTTGDDDNDLHIASSMLKKGNALYRHKDLRAAVKVYDELISLFQTHRSIRVRGFVTRAHRGRESALLKIKDQKTRQNYRELCEIENILFLEMKNGRNLGRRVDKLDSEEISSIANAAWDQAAAETLKASNPIAVRVDGQVFRVYPDGRKEKLTALGGPYDA